MSRQIKPLAQRVAGARYAAAPSAPSAPSVRSTMGSMAGQAVAYRNPASANTDPPGNAPDAGIGRDHKPGPQNKKPTDIGAKGKTPGQLTPQNDPRDSTYYTNTAALNAQYALERGQNILARNQERRDYERNRSEILTDRSRAKRDLAVSMLGTGGAYSGSHLRQQAEGDRDHMDYLDRVDTDYNRGLQQRYLEMNDIDSRLAYGTGSEYLKEMELAKARKVEAGLDDAATGDPIDKNKKGNKDKGDDGPQQDIGDGPATGVPPLGARIRTRNRQIKTLKAKIEKTSNPHREKALRERLQAARKQRNKLVKKAKAKKDNG